MNSAKVIGQLTKIIDDLSHGNLGTNIDISVRDLKQHCSECQELEGLIASINILLSKQREARDFLLNLSSGKLETDIPKGNQLISPLKELHANLRHLAWQTQRIAEGDYNQNIDFLGDFSKSFNSLISTLRQKHTVEKCLEASEKNLRFITDNITDVI